MICRLLNGDRSTRLVATLSRPTVAITVIAFMVAAGPHLMAMPEWLAVSILLACAWRIGTAWMNWNPPHWSVRIFLTLTALGAVIFFYGTLWGRRAATGLLCVMIAAKLMEMFRTRDARQIASLGFFLVAAQFLFSQQITLLPYLLLACTLATTAMLCIQKDEDRQQHPVRSNRSGPDQASKYPTAKNQLNDLKNGIMLLGMAIPFALMLFVIFPRLASPLWGLPEDALDGRSGLSDEMSPGSIASLYADDSPAFRVEFDGERPTQSELYWRGPVLWRLNGTTWRRLITSNPEPEQMPAEENPRWHYRVQLEPNERRWLFTLDYPLDWSEDAHLTGDFQLIRKRPVTRLISYSTVSQPDFTDSPELLPSLRNIALRLPEGQNPRTMAKAAEFRDQYTDDRELINAVLRWFNEDGFFYSLETMPLGWNGADEFLFDIKTGYCEYYASAFAILMRAAGIPARIVTGYQGGFWQESSEYLLVRQSDAHAWVEVWLKDSGWSRVDPTAAVSPSRILENARSALNEPLNWLGAVWVQSLRNQYDRLQHYWNQWALGFNAARQQDFFSRIGLDHLSAPWLAALVVVLATITIAPLAFLIRGLGQSRMRLGQEQRCWQRLIKRLNKQKLKPVSSETALEFAYRAAAVLHNGDELIQAAKLYNQLRYSEPGVAHNKLMLLMQRYSREWKPDFNAVELNSGDQLTLQINQT